MVFDALRGNWHILLSSSMRNLVSNHILLNHQLSCRKPLKRKSAAECHIFALRERCIDATSAAAACGNLHASPTHVRSEKFRHRRTVIMFGASYQLGNRPTNSWALLNACHERHKDDSYANLRHHLHHQPPPSSRARGSSSVAYRAH